jgi:outer membrane receptor protein involved in Fe transport
MKASKLLSTSAVPALILGYAFAATAPAMAQEAAAADEDVIVITGSRIARPDYTSPNPITSVDTQQLQQSGETNLTQFLQGVPALVGSFDNAQSNDTNQGFIGSVGLNLLNLRNLGVERTLVLVDGRRHVAQLPETAAVDINTIPTELIERIDVVTGGTGAIYGADAVSGVVNFVLKKDFEGLVLNGQIGVGGEGEPTDWQVSATVGKNFAGGRGNITAAFQMNREGRLEANDRAMFRRGNWRNFQNNPADPDDDPNLPDRVPLADVRFNDTAREGAIDVDFDGAPDFMPDGTPFDIGEFIQPGYSVGGSGTRRSDYLVDLLPEAKRYLGNVFLNYEFSDAARFFGEVKYARTDAFALSQPSFDYLIMIQPDNAFIPAALRPILEESGGAWVNRDNFDLGNRGEDNKRETWRTVVGLRGDVTDSIQYEVSYVWGQSKVKNVSTNDRLDDRFFAAIDAVRDDSGNIVCRSSLDPSALMDQEALNFFTDPFTYGDKPFLSFTPGANSGCVPLNIFGEGVASQAAIDWVMFDNVSRSKLSQHVVTGFVSGTVPGLSLPGGDVGFSVGAEYRKEKSSSTPDPLATAGLTFGNLLFPTRGDFDVKEAFAEVRLPLLRDQPFAELLEVSGAIRVSDYSTVGSTTTWNVNGTWSPVRDIRLRGTYAQAVRAPNIGELFSPQSQTFEFITDPCDIDELNNGTSNRAQNCATVLTALGFDPATFEDPNTFTVIGRQQGNPNLGEETAKSWTAGLVLQPRFIPGLNVSLDWYDIKIKDAINQATAEEVAENCVDAPTLDNVFCAALTRGAQTGGISNFILQPENVANFRTSGLDFNISYRFDPARAGISDNIGIFNIRLFGNYLDKLEFIPAPGADLDDDRGEQYAPKWQLTADLTWELKPVTINYGFNYFSKTTRYSNAELVGDPDMASEENIYYNARHTHDLQVAFNLDQYRFYAGVNNFTNQKPDLSTIYPVNAVGRYFYAGARLAFRDLF